MQPATRSFRIWLAIEDSPRLASIDRNTLYAEIEQSIQGWVPYGWQTTISEPPQEILADAIYNARDLSMQDITLLYEPPKEDPNVVKIKEEAETATDDAESVQGEEEDVVTSNTTSSSSEETTSSSSEISEDVPNCMQNRNTTDRSSRVGCSWQTKIYDERTQMY